MLTTLELRWFSHGTPPIEVEHWFHADCPGEPLGSSEEREDVYLYSPECDYLNLKLRQGSLEVKWRKAELGSLRSGALWEGNVEKWVKWICQDPDQSGILPENVVGKGLWVGVKKKRSQRHYQGIVFELTQLTIGKDAWWSIAFEMVDPGDNRIDRFKNVVNRVSQTYQGQNLQAEQSYGYPSWLLRVWNPERDRHFIEPN